MRFFAVTLFGICGLARTSTVGLEESVREAAQLRRELQDLKGKMENLHFPRELIQICMIVVTGNAAIGDYMMTLGNDYPYHDPEESTLPLEEKIKILEKGFGGPGGPRYEKFTACFRALADAALFEKIMSATREAALREKPRMDALRESDLADAATVEKMMSVTREAGLREKARMDALREKARMDALREKARMDALRESDLTDAATIEHIMDVTRQAGLREKARMDALRKSAAASTIQKAWKEYKLKVDHEDPIADFQRAFAPYRADADRIILEEARIDKIRQLRAAKLDEIVFNPLSQVENNPGKVDGTIKSFIMDEWELSEEEAQRLMELAADE